MMILLEQNKNPSSVEDVAATSSCDTDDVAADGGGGGGGGDATFTSLVKLVKGGDEGEDQLKNLLVSFCCFSTFHLFFFILISAAFCL